MGIESKSPFSDPSPIRDTRIQEGQKQENVSQEAESKALRNEIYAEGTPKNQSKITLSREQANHMFTKMFGENIKEDQLHATGANASRIYNLLIAFTEK